MASQSVLNPRDSLMRADAQTMLQAAQSSAAQGDWPRAFLELWRSFDRFSLVILEERFRVGATGSEIDRFAMRRAVVTILPEAVKRDALNDANAQSRDIDDFDLDGAFVALLDELFELHNDVTQFGNSGAEDNNRYNFAYERLAPVVRYMQNRLR